MNTLKLSKLNKTWIFDLDGTIFPHNGYLNSKSEEPLEGVVKFFKTIPKNDFVLILTTRSSKFREVTENNLNKCGLRWDLLLMDMPNGERILINDSKPSGLITAYALCLDRDSGLGEINLKIDHKY